jgi:hypothetical protein
MSDAYRAELHRTREELKKAEKAMADHKRNAHGGGAEWCGTWDKGHWRGHNSADLNKIYTTLYIKVEKALENVEKALYKVDPFRRDLDSTIEHLKEQRKNASDSKDNACFHPLLDRLVMVIQRKRDYEAKAGKYHECLCKCTHYFQSGIVPCDCVADKIGFLSLSDVNEERLKNKRLCFIGDYYSLSGSNYGKPVRGPVKPCNGILHIDRKWVKVGTNIVQRCEHYHLPYSGLIHEPREMVPCDCIKKQRFLNENPENIWIKNAYYILESDLPITILREYNITGVSYQGSDTLGFECNHYTQIEGCTTGDFNEQCDCQATGELSEKMKKFDSLGLVQKKFDGKHLNAMSKITITRETRGLIPHPQGHICRHEREDGGIMECDCILLFNKHAVEKFEDVMYELSDDMKRRQAAGRVILADCGKLQVGGFFKHVFFPGLISGKIERAKPYDDDKYVVD